MFIDISYILRALGWGYNPGDLGVSVHVRISHYQGELLEGNV